MKKAKKYYIILGIIQVVIAICFIVVGIVIEVNTSIFLTNKLHFISNFSYPFFFIPDHFILAFHGIGNLIGAFFSFMRFNFTGKLGVFLGTLLFLWIIIQIIIIGLISFMQPLLIAIGFVEAILGYTIYKKLKKQSQHNYYY
ncbi:MAG: hypothetical protein HY951_01305 [Bacteroidia bacterium]|nr:hypothetical protein [Bacteroidia bacterium]